MLAVETTVPSGTGSGPYIGVIRDRRERSYTVTSAKVSIMCVCGGGGGGDTFPYVCVLWWYKSCSCL